MPRLPTIIGAGLGAAATASAIAVTSGTAQAPGERTLTFVERSNDAATVLADVPPFVKNKREFAGKGDTFLSPSTVSDSTGATKVGTFVGRCTLLRATKRVLGSVAICDGIHNLRDGTITVSAYLTFSDKPITFAVTGGTGAYEGARGSGVSTDRPGNNPLSDTVIHLLP